MQRNVFILLLIAFGFPAFAQNITGSWGGTLDIQGNKLRLVFNITKTDSAYVTKLDSPDQGAFGLPTTKTTFGDNRLEIVASGLGLSYSGTLEQDSINGTFSQGGMSFPLILKPVSMPELNRPQMPKEPLPYKTEEVMIANKKDDVYLSGTLTMPDSAALFPAVILIAGSGPNDRDETVFGHKPFLVLADYLTRNGFAVLRYDKRGVGKSSGDYRKATTEDFASDVQAAIEFLKQRNEIDKKRIGLIGHSEGGTIAPMVAAKNKNVDYIVLMAGMGVKASEILLDQNVILLRQEKVDSTTIENLKPVIADVLNYVSEWEGTEANKTVLRDKITQMWEKLPILLRLKVKKDVYIRNNYNVMITPWYRNFVKIDPSVYLEQVKCPVFALNGEKDSQVPAAKNLAAIESALKKGKNTHFEIKEYPNLNHLFQESETGYADEYGKIEQTISPRVLSDIVNWINAQTR